jgi:cell division protein FtsB
VGGKPRAQESRREGALAFARRHWPRLLLSAAILAVFFGNQGFSSLVRNYMELRRLRGELAGLKAREASVGERLKRLRSGGGELERAARKELGFIKKGELEYRFPPPAPAGEEK